MVKILFVCLGNICRSTMAEYVMKYLVEQAGQGEAFFIDSAGTSAEETGNPVHPGTRRRLGQAGIPCGGHRARQMRPADYGRFDLLIGMEEANLRDMRRIAGGDPAGKIRKLLDVTPRPRDIADPWYTGDFDATFDDVWEGCQALLAWCLKNS